MVCVSCGKEITEDSRFCNYCGAKQEKPEPVIEKMYCSQCQKEFDSEMVYCDECGNKLTASANSESSEADHRSSILLRIELASFCRGSSPVGSAMSNGTVYLYEDRIETKKVLENKAEVLAKMEDIASVSKGNFLSIWSTLTIQLKNGTAYTIAGAATSDTTIKQAIDIIKRNLD